MRRFACVETFRGKTLTRLYIVLKLRVTNYGAYVLKCLTPNIFEKKNLDDEATAARSDIRKSEPGNVLCISHCRFERGEKTR